VVVRGGQVVIGGGHAVVVSPHILSIRTPVVSSVTFLQAAVVETQGGWNVLHGGVASEQSLPLFTLQGG